MNALKCLQCLVEGKLGTANGNGEQVANDAITLAPSWQMQQIGPQQIMACVAVPCCGPHLTVQRKSPLETAKPIILGRAER